MLKNNKRDFVKPTYQRMFWLFMVGSIAGVIIEGVWYYFVHDRWETHVVSIWGPFCIIYGLGAVAFYIGNYYLRERSIIIRYLAFAALGDAVELLCGLVLKYGLHMKAWTYSHYPYNFMGLICLKMTIIWGFVGIAFQFLIPPSDRMLDLMEGKYWHYSCIALTVFMAVNFALTAVCLIRWKQRHFGSENGGRFMQWIDRNYDDDFMDKRFIEWWFID